MRCRTGNQSSPTSRSHCPFCAPAKKISRAPLGIYRSNTVKIELDSSLASRFGSTCRRTKVSPFNFYLASFRVLLYRRAGGKLADICIGIADSGRNNHMVTDSVGFFLNPLPLRFQQQPSEVFRDALNETRSKVITTLANSKVPFDVLLNEVNAPRTSTSSLLFQAFVNYREEVQERRQFCGCDSEAIQFDASQTAYDLGLDILGNTKNVVIYLAGQSALYNGFRKLSKNDLKLVNAYGPAEATLAVGSAEVRYMTDDELDTPFDLFPNYSIYIMDSQQHPVPAGIPGEIYIGVAGVAQGYLNHDALTKERFLPDDFAPRKYTLYNWTTMHTSGDHGYFALDGHLFLDGRIDDDAQIKLRGIRIDRRAIESIIVQQANGAIQDAITSVHGSSGTEYLIAYVVMSATFNWETLVFLVSENFLTNRTVYAADSCDHVGSITN
ncbi:AMP-dependent synthetase/ligase, partial [Metarhizium majus ARSEF 297]